MITLLWWMDESHMGPLGNEEQSRPWIFCRNCLANPPGGADAQPFLEGANAGEHYSTK
jgi:hypothetical protein